MAAKLWPGFMLEPEYAREIARQESETRQLEDEAYDQTDYRAEDKEAA